MTELLTHLPENAPPAFPRVVVFITRAGQSGLELLLQPADGQPRLPEDNVAADETPEEAVARLTNRLIRTRGAPTLLGVISEALTDRRIVLRPQFLRTAPEPNATLMRFMLDRGVKVQAHEANGSYTRVVYQEFALTDGDFALTTRRAGWIATSALCGRVDHFLFHLVVTGGDQTTPPEIVWTPMARVAGLPAEQQQWLAQVADHLNH